MAELVVEGDQVVLRMSGLEEAEALHGEVRVPLSAVVGVEVLDDAIGAVEGLRAPGLGVPGAVAVGTFRAHDAKTFAVVHHATPRGVRVDLAGADYDRLIVGCADPEAIAAKLVPKR